MVRTIIKMGRLIAGGIGIYISILVAQSRAAAGLCESYPGGTRIDALENLKGTFLLTQMAPLDDPHKPGTQTVVFSASLTMCDTSCRLEIEDGLVKHAIHSAH